MSELTYEGFPRRDVTDYRAVIVPGNSPTEYAKAIEQAYAQVPEEYRASAKFFTEDSDADSDEPEYYDRVEWKCPETDEQYTARWEKHAGGREMYLSQQVKDAEYWITHLERELAAMPTRIEDAKARLRKARKDHEALLRDYTPVAKRAGD